MMRRGVFAAAGLMLSLTAASGAEDRFENPARCAFGHHQIHATLRPDPGEGKQPMFEAVDRMVLLHEPGVPPSLPVPFLLNRHLDIRRVHASTPEESIALEWEAEERWEPCDFWEKPEYPELSGFEHARQVNLLLARPGRYDAWPESILVAVTYEGVIYDSLKPPPENYQRGFETTSGLIDPRGAFLSGGTLWYPQRFDAPSTFQLTATVPEDWMTVSQGQRIVPESGEPITWNSPQPMDEIYLIAGPYVLREEDHEGIAIQTFTYGNDDEELCRGYLDATRDYLDLYGDLIGPYPFDKFALVENFWQTGYGMPSFTFLGNRVIRLPWIVKTSYGHEILHNWWGNGVFVDYESGNWCEGLTVYGADYLYKERESDQAAREYRRTQLQGYLDYARAGRDFPLTEFRARHDASSAAVGYGKSMMLYHMLRRDYGDRAFWNRLAIFYNRFLFQLASWADLLAVFEEGTSRDLGEFYEQWIARTGAPVLRLAAADLRPRSDGRVDLAFTLEQDEPYYTLAVPVRVTFEDAEPENWTIPLDGPRYEGRVTLPQQPLALEVDPEFDVFRRLHRAEVPAALSQLFGADSLTVILAGDDPDIAAYRALADEAQKAKPTAVVADDGIVLPDLEKGGAWVMGEIQWIDRLRGLLPPSLEIRPDSFRLFGQDYDRATHTLVATLPHPRDPDEAIGLLLGADADPLPDIWRKLPHYGKQSYLVFEGTSNVAKGTWPVGRSPLRMLWKEEG